MPRAEINGVSIHYQQMGQGVDLVLIHGLFTNLAFWYLSVLPLLAKDFRVTAYDLRGHGYSGMPRSGYTTAHMASELCALLDHLAVEQAHLVGHSFGGAVGLHYTTLYPDRVLSLTLADARIPSLQPALPSRLSPRWKGLRSRLRRAGIEVPSDLPRVAYSFFEEMARLRRRGPAENRNDWAPALRPLACNGSLGVNRRWVQLMRTTSAPQELQAIADLTVERIRRVTRPTLGIFGEYSGCLKTLRGLQANMPGCRVAIVPEVGHLHPIVKPQVFVQKLRQFIQETENGVEQSSGPIPSQAFQSKQALSV